MIDPTSKLNNVRRRLVSISLLAVLALTTASCSGSPATVTAPTPGPVSSSATPTPTDTAAVAEVVSVSAETITITAQDGEVVHTLNYFQPVADVAPTLSEVFGFQPVVDTVPTYEGPRIESYSWGGFTILDYNYDYDGDGVELEAADAVYYPDFRVSITAGAVGTVSLETLGGIAVGDDSVEIETANAANSTRFIPSNVGYEIAVIRLGDVALPDRDFGDGGSDKHSFFVTVQARAGEAVEEIFAPSGGGPGI